jgi:hypothetical protein
VDNFKTESVDNFDRNRWTTSNGTGGQLQVEWPVNIDRNTQFMQYLPANDRELIQTRFENRHADFPAEFRRQYPTKSILRYQTARVISRLQAMAGEIL